MDSSQNIAIFSENEPFRATKMWNELVKNFKSGVRLKKRRWRMKYYEDCFSGSDALAWIHDFLNINPNFGHNVSRSQAKLLCQKLLQRCVFEDAVVQLKSTKPLFEESHLYRFVSKSGVAKEGRVGSNNTKENANSKSKVAKTSTKVSLKRHSSFSERLQFSRKPLTERKALQNISNEVDAKNSMKQTHMKPTRDKMKKCLKNEKHGVVLQNVGSIDKKSVKSNARMSEKQSGEVVLGLSRKWKSEYDISLMERNMEIHDEDNEEDMSCDVEEMVLQGAKPIDQPQMSKENKETNADSCREECFPQADLNELWVKVCLERLKHALNVDTLNGILEVDLLNYKNVMENVISELRCALVTEAVPKWLVSATKCLIHWPQSVKSYGAGPDYSGFENDIFNTILEHFQLLPEPLVSSNFIQVFTKISGLITKCKLSAIRALQLILLFLKKDWRQQLQLLLRFMIKISNNHQLNLSNHIPTRELVIQKFVPCIFGGKENRHVHEILGIRITSFIMENYAEVFKVPNGLKFEVEQQIAFLKQKGTINQSGGIQTNDITYCLRVTKQEYEEQKQFGTQRFLEDLLNNVVRDEKINEKERKKKLKEFEKTYPEIYYSRYPEDGLSVLSQQSVPDKLRRAMKPLTRRQMKDLR